MGNVWVSHCENPPQPRPRLHMHAALDAGGLPNENAVRYTKLSQQSASSSLVVAI